MICAPLRVSSAPAWNLGIALERATGRSVTQWLEDTLWRPLGAQHEGLFLLDSTSDRFEKVPSGLTGTPIDLVKLGVLYLDDGVWDGRQLVPANWVTQTTAFATAGPTGLPGGVRYAVGWWAQVIHGTGVYYAWGNHGEYILVAPGLDIVVARFGTDYGTTGYGTHAWPQIMTAVAEHVAAANPSSATGGP